MKRVLKLMLTPGFFAVLVMAVLSCSSSENAPRITKEDLSARIEKGDVMVLDVRSAKDWESAKSKIHTAVREDPKQVKTWAVKYPKDKTLVLYCA